MGVEKRNRAEVLDSSQAVPERPYSLALFMIVIKSTWFSLHFPLRLDILEARVSLCYCDKEFLSLEGTDLHWN